MTTDPKTNEVLYHVIKEMERLSRCYEDIARARSEDSKSIARLEVKAGLWGALSGLIASIVLLAKTWFK